MVPMLASCKKCVTRNSAGCTFYVYQVIIESCVILAKLIYSTMQGNDIHLFFCVHACVITLIYVNEHRRCSGRRSK